MPTSNLPGWTFVAGDDFTGASTVPTDPWFLYDGIPGGTTEAQWDSSHVTLGNSIMTLSTYKDPAVNSDPTIWVSGGAMFYRPQIYGKYLVRWRADTGDGVAAIGLLWPDNGGWPPEIDFFEDGGGDRQSTQATLHFEPTNEMIWRDTTGDFTQWHTLGVEWTPGRVDYTKDGAVWGTVQDSVEGVSAVPDIEMYLVLQTQMWESTVNTPTVVNMYVDWIVQYAYTP